MEDEKKWRIEVEQRLRDLTVEVNALKLQFQNKGKIPFRSMKAVKPVDCIIGSGKKSPPLYSPKKRILEDVETLPSEHSSLKVVLFEDFHLEKAIRPKEKEVLEYIFSNADPHEVLVLSDDIALTRFDFRYLGPGIQLETGIISMVSKLLTDNERLNASKSGTINWYLPVRLLKGQVIYSKAELGSIWKQMKYFERYMGVLDRCNEIFIPILHDKHYILARVFVKDRKVEVWDSLSRNEFVIIQRAKIEEILRALDLVLEEQIKLKPSNFSFASFKIVRARNVPRQPNSFDCGVFVIMFMMDGCRLDSRSIVFNSDEERCLIASWIACSNFNLRRAQLLKDI